MNKETNYLTELYIPEKREYSHSQNLPLVALKHNDININIEFISLQLDNSPEHNNSLKYDNSSEHK